VNLRRLDGARSLQAAIVAVGDRDWGSPGLTWMTRAGADDRCCRAARCRRRSPPPQLPAARLTGWPGGRGRSGHHGDPRSRAGSHDPGDASGRRARGVDLGEAHEAGRPAARRERPAARVGAVARSTPRREGRGCSRPPTRGPAFGSVRSITPSAGGGGHGEPAARRPSRRPLRGPQKNSARSLLRAAGPILYCFHQVAKEGT
jgi:hypothetical protein